MLSLFGSLEDYWTSGHTLPLHLHNENLPRAIIDHRRILKYLFIFKLSHCYLLFYLSFMIDTLKVLHQIFVIATICYIASLDQSLLFLRPKSNLYY